ncbi:hypothetical protein B5X24_HaOG214508 [Helicoverpa armigera]|uniref:Uncharacterized protein n=1 Tax=Helicoverpa armigera TaxID=29058 RepID=A0A2W1B2U1_HELAM|nr:hypothetical protein B5X24_HaOG214508 [Helicoverpa armigera]
MNLLLSTFQANIRALRREEFRAQLSDTGAPDAAARWHDARLAERLRMKAQLEKLQNEISQIARKTGISSATKLALLAADTPDSDRVPDIECTSKNYEIPEKYR